MYNNAEWMEWNVMQNEEYKKIRLNFMPFKVMALSTTMYTARVFLHVPWINE